MERRQHRRFSRRIEVRFWRRGDPQAHSAFTTNISKSGLFLGSGAALQPGERIRLEVIDRDGGFFAEGRVARVHRVSLSLRHVDQPGVGVRFLRPEELVEELLPLARQSETGTAGGSAEAAGARVAATIDAGAADAALGDASTPVVEIEFDDASAFLSVFHRDISSGGLFISSPNPAPLHSEVIVEMRLPLPDFRPRLFRARVIQRFEPQGAVAPGRNVLSGMAVQFTDASSVVEDLRPLLDELRRRR